MSTDNNLEFFVQKLKRVFDKSPEGMVISDMTKDDHPIVYANDTFFDMTGYAKQEVVGHNCRFLQNNDREQAGIKQIRTAIKASESCRVTLRNYRKDGSLFYNRLSLFPIHDENNKTKFYVGIQDDISDLIMSKEEIAELERLNKFKNQMMGMAAHDLRNPLMVIQNYADFLIDDHIQKENVFTEDQYQLIKQIKESSKYMVHFIEDMLDMSSIDSGRINLKKENCNLIDLIEQVTSLSRSTANKKDIVIITHLPDSSVTKEIDAHKFRQVLDNLISNAVKYSDPKTEIEVGINSTDKADEVAIYIKDQGLGIPEDEIDKLFKPFSKTSVKPTAGENSTGLGLAIVKKIVEAHGGEIDVDSEVGVGSTFVVKLP